MNTREQYAEVLAAVLAEDDREIHDGDCEAEWETGAMAYTVCGCVVRTADALAAALPDPEQAVREAQAKAWDAGYETRAATLGMSLDPNPYREALPDPEQAVRETDERIIFLRNSVERLTRELAEAHAANGGLLRERNTWARQMADVTDERVTLTDAEVKALHDINGIWPDLLTTVEAIVAAHSAARVARVEALITGWRGGTGHRDTDKWITVADLRAALGALPDPEQAVREDSLAHWLWWRFGNGTQDPAAFNALPLDVDVDDKGYWEHEARAVRRAVARGGFRVTDGEPWTMQDREAHP